MNTLSKEDRQFIINLANTVDGIRAKQKATDTRLTTLEHNNHALHARMNKLEAELHMPPEGMRVVFSELLPGFTTPAVQAQIFNGSLRKLLREFNVKKIEGQMEL